MSNIEALLRQELERNAQQDCASLQSESYDDYLSFVRAEMDKVIGPNRDALALRLMSDFIAQGHIASCLELIETSPASGTFYCALKIIVFEMINTDQNVPQEFLRLFAEVEIGLRPRPKNKKGKAHAFRDHQICRCIAALQRNANLTPRRSAASKASCGCAIVAEALGLTYDAVEKVWKVRDKAMWDK